MVWVDRELISQSQTCEKGTLPIRPPRPVRQSISRTPPWSIDYSTQYRVGGYEIDFCLSKIKAFQIDLRGHSSSQGEFKGRLSQCEDKLTEWGIRGYYWRFSIPISSTIKLTSHYLFSDDLRWPKMLLPSAGGEKNRVHRTVLNLTLLPLTVWLSRFYDVINLPISTCVCSISRGKVTSPHEPNVLTDYFVQPCDQTGWPNELSVHLMCWEIVWFESTGSNPGDVKPVT